MRTKEQPKSRHNYFSGSLIGRESVERTLFFATQQLSTVNFDTLVVRGMSGAVAGGLFAYHLDKNLYVIRKDDDSSHDGANGFGIMGRRWVFLDDFISSGETYKVVRDEVLSLWEDGIFDNRDYNHRTDEWKTIKHPKPLHVGTYLYRDERFRNVRESVDLCYSDFQ